MMAQRLLPPPPEINMASSPTKSDLPPPVTEQTNPAIMGFEPVAINPGEEKAGEENIPLTAMHYLSMLTTCKHHPHQ